MTESEQTILDVSQYLGEIKNLSGQGLNKQSIIPWEHTRLLPQKHPYSQHSFKVRQLYNKESCYWEAEMPCLSTGKPEAVQESGTNPVVRGDCVLLERCPSTSM